jgi:hypothetical protein
VSAPNGDRRGPLDYDAADLRRLQELKRGPFEDPGDLRAVVDQFGYFDEWRDNYRIQSVQSSLHQKRITCLDSAIMSYGLLELLFPDVKRRLLAIHRRDRFGEECGHCVALYWGDDGKIGSFSKSSYPGLGHRDPVYADELAIATSYAKAYVDMGITPLYFGVTTLEECAPDIDWRFSRDDLSVLSERIQAHYEYGFMLPE